MASINAVHRLENMRDDTLATKQDLAALKAEMKEAIAQSKNTMVIWYVSISAIVPILNVLIGKAVSKW